MTGRVRADEAAVMAANDKPTVVLYTHSLLGPSMTFILSHAEALKRYRPVFAGSHRVHGLELPESRVVTANRGGMLGSVDEFLFRRLRLGSRFASRLRKFEPSLIHAHFGQSGPAALTVARRLGIPLIVTYHGQDATVSDKELRRSWRGREYLRGRMNVMRNADLIIAVSEFIRVKLLECGFPESKLVTHRNGIDLRYFNRAGLSREQVVVFVGRFVEKKGCEYFVRALGQLRQSRIAVRGVAIGDGVLGPELKRLAGQVRADIAFTGFLRLDDVRTWLGRASAVVVPSVTAADGNSEGLPTVILEAQAMGTPVVSTRHAGNAEGVSEGHSALLVAERDVDGLASAIRFFIENPQAVESFGAAGRALVEAQFNIDAQAEGLERLYDRIVEAARWA